MKNVILPEGYDKSRLKAAVKDLIALTQAKAEALDQKISFCGSATSWEECITGFMRKNGTVVLLLQYNIGPSTYAVNMEVEA